MTAAGRAYSHELTVGGADCDPRGRAHLTTLSRWLQEIAVADSLDAGLDRYGAWIIRRTALAVRSLPRFGERVEVRTWCSGLAKSIAERTTTIAGEEGASVESVAIWVHIDPQTRLPARLPEVFHRGFAESAGDHRPRTSLRHPASPPDDAEELSWRFTDADIDIAGHVNNTMYWRLAEELLPAIEGPVSAEAEYRAGAGTGETAVRRAGGMLWVLGSGGEVAATLALAPLED